MDLRPGTFLLQGARSAGVSLRELSPAERGALHERLWQELGLRLPARRVWETLPAAFSQVDTEAWRRFAELFHSGHLFVLFDRDDDERVFEVEGGAALSEALGEASAIEFYVATADGAGLVCVNHHDCIVAWGAVAEHLKRLYGGCQKLCVT